MLNKASEIVSTLLRVLRIRFDKSPIARMPQLVEFVSTRSAYVAQTSLFGYLKTRMGREYVKIFNDDRFLPSIERAKWEIYAACLSDLSVYATSLVSERGGLEPDGAVSLARHLHSTCVDDTFKGEFAESIRSEALSGFEGRSGSTIWANAVVGEAAFSLSPAALADASPVSEEYRELDREIVKNSIRLRWGDVRNQLRKRLDGKALCGEWNSGLHGGNALELPSVAAGSRAVDP